MRSIKNIEILVQHDIRILKIYEDEGATAPEDRFSWWAVNEFKPAILSGDSPVPHHEVTGVEITDFINMNVSVQDPKDFARRIDTFIEDTRVMICKFHKDMKYKLYVQ